jgi:hypothetical protein
MEVGCKDINCIKVAQWGDNCVLNIGGIASIAACFDHCSLLDFVVFTVAVEG